MIVSGAATLQMKDAKAISLQAGAFALMPSHHVHQIRCLRACALYIYSDTAFDIHYVDKQGNEITPADARAMTRSARSMAQDGSHQRSSWARCPRDPKSVMTEDQPGARTSRCEYSGIIPVSRR